MPKPISLMIKVEEIALGHVFRHLKSYPGILSIELEPEHQSHRANGHAGKIPRPTGPRAAIPGGTIKGFFLQTLAKGPKNHKELGAALSQFGRSPNSVGSQIDTMMHKDKEVVRNKEGYYSLTPKGKKSLDAQDNEARA